MKEEETSLKLKFFSRSYKQALQQVTGWNHRSTTHWALAEKNLTCYVKPHFFLRLSRNHKWAIRNSIALHGKNKRYHRLLLSISFCPLRSIWCRSESSSLSLGWSLFQESVVCCIIHWCVLSCQATMQWGYITVRWKQQKPNFAF